MCDAKPKLNYAEDSLEIENCESCPWVRTTSLTMALLGKEKTCCWNYVEQICVFTRNVKSNFEYVGILGWIKQIAGTCYSSDNS